MGIVDVAGKANVGLALYSHRDLRIHQRVAIPIGGWSVAGDQIHRVVDDAEPDLDLVAVATRPSDSRHVAAVVPGVLRQPAHENVTVYDPGR